MKKNNKRLVLSITTSLILFLSHIAILIAILSTWRYYYIYPELFIYITIIILCVLAILDIVYFIGFRHTDIALKMTSCIIAFFILLGGTFGSYFVGKANKIVDNVLDNGSEKYEKHSGVFVCYDKNNEFDSLSDLTGKTIGMITETGEGISSIAQSLLTENKIDYARIDYKTNAELITALLDGKIDAMVINSAYRDIYSIEHDENSPFDQYLSNFIDFYSFEKDIKVTSTKVAKNISKEPFNVLLIGYSRTDIGSPIGLADAIILATINPQTYTVSMMSIARDSFVPIPCYGGEYDKINSPRSTSRQAFIDTVENFVGMDIDYYMELDYLGLVAIVNTIGGIVIDNPVTFELDGIYVPEGKYLADGQMALQFCRERHHMPNGDFDRQQHQKEVIMSIAEKFISSGDISLALKAMENASEYMSTDLSLEQLTTIFNLLLNTKNYTSLDTFNLVDFQTLRITGYGGILYYSYSMRLPLWVYLIYKGSFDESMNHVYDVMGKHKSINQIKTFSFTIREKYERPALYSLEYPNVFLYEPDPMPAYWITLSGKTVEEAMSWASANGVTLSIEYIDSSDERYNETLEGLVCDQSVRYGQLVSDFPSGTITVMGSSEIDESKVVPNFVGKNYSKAIEWANEYGIPYSVDFNTDVDGSVGEVVEQNPSPFTSIDKCEKLKIVVKAGSYTISFDKNGHGSSTPKSITVVTGDKTVKFESLDNVTEADATYIFDGWYTDKTGGKKVSDSSDISGDKTLYAHWVQLFTVTFNNDGETEKRKTTDGMPSDPSKQGYIFEGWFTEKSGGTKVSSLSSITSNTTLYAHWKKCEEHSWNSGVVTKEATCTEKGEHTYTCKKCGATETREDIDALGHKYKSYEIPATCEKDGEKGKECSRCGDKIEIEIIPKLTEGCSVEPDPEDDDDDEDE